MKTVHQRPWVENGFVTDKGIACTELHVLRVMSLAKAKAALMTTAIIHKMMRP